jgi:hypothetical protein
VGPGESSVNVYLFLPKETAVSLGKDFRERKKAKGHIAVSIFYTASGEEPLIKNGRSILFSLGKLEGLKSLSAG